MMTSLSSRAMWRLLLVYLILFSNVEAFSWRNILGGSSKKQDRRRLDKDRQKVIQPAQDFGSNQDGSAQVYEALSELREISVSKRIIGRDKKSGIIGATAHFAKEAFVLLFMNGPKQDPLNSVNEPVVHLTKPLSNAVKLLEGAADAKQNPDAIFLLAEMNFWGNFSHPRNHKQAFKRYQQLADLNGNSTAQHMLGVYYATGLAGVVLRDQAKAQMYYTFAAEQGNTRSEMTLAYRAHAGIGVRKDCEVATSFYKRVADKAIAYSRSGPPGGQMLSRDAYHLADDVGGTYGKGASVASSGINARRPKIWDQTDESRLEYLDLLSRNGDFVATYSLGTLHYDGNRKVKRNFRKAGAYFLKVARNHWDPDDKVIKRDDNNADAAKWASKAAAYLGRLHLRGEGTKTNFKEALRWFKLGVEAGEPFCQYEMGLMHLLGLGVRQDAVLAADYLKQAALQDWAAAQARLGRLFIDQGDLGTAITYFQFAYARDHIEGHYHLAEINNLQVEGQTRNCGMAQHLYKIVAEKVQALHSDFADANQLYGEGDVEGAFLRYLMAAEQGYEAAQANVAWLLDQKRPLSDIGAWLPWAKPLLSSEVTTALGSTRPVLNDPTLALVYWTRSAHQLNADSAVKMGDAYFYGIGASADVDKAATCYQFAADNHQAPQAMWNLGWMHENGIGAPQDFHLAKRQYDLSLEVAPETYLPVKLALWKLRMRSRWNDWIGGNIKSMEYDDDIKEQKYSTWGEWLANFLEDEHTYHRHDDYDAAHDDGYGYDWADSAGLSDAYLLDDIEDSMLESLVILALLGLLVWLVWYRQQRQQQQQQQQQQRQQEQLHRQPA